MIHDNHSASAHISKETKARLAQQPAGRFEFTFKPKHGNRPMRAARSSGSSGCAFRVNGWRPVPGKKLMELCNEMIVDAREVFDAAKYFGTPKDRIVQETVPGGHIGLFMGARTLKEHWPRIARWMPPNRCNSNQFDRIRFAVRFRSARVNGCI